MKQFYDMEAFEQAGLQVPAEWEKLAVEGISGVQMVVGAPDVGKTTFARYLFQRISESGEKVAYLDGDPGQSFLGPPGTQTLVFGETGSRAFPPEGRVWRKFVGSVSPRGHLLPTVVGASRLVRKALHSGASAVIYDTSGLVDPKQGGLALKYAKIDMLEPNRVYAIQREKELNPLIMLLRRSQRCKVIQLSPADAAVTRSQGMRQAYRSQKFAAYFHDAELQKMKWNDYGIYPAPRFAMHRLIALEDREGFTLALGIVVEIDRVERLVTLLAPAVDLDAFRGMNLGDIMVDPHTFRDYRPI